MAAKKIEREWVSDDTERKVLQEFDWRKLNMRRPYDRKLAAVLLAFEGETKMCGAERTECRVIGFGLKKLRQHMAIEIRHGKRCLSKWWERRES